ncbi:MAG: hypothetical protein LUH54_04790 [Firmicutes bacterium]|nr:hypothetical protein [Bacillota bacterium]
MKAYGKKVWLIPDAFLGSESKNDLTTHEAVCAINTGAVEAKLDFTLLFEDREPLTGFSAVVGAGRTNHVRLDKIRGADGEGIPYDTPYAILVESSEPVVVQYSRLDASHAELALMTTIAWCAE